MSLSYLCICVSPTLCVCTRSCVVRFWHLIRSPDRVRHACQQLPTQANRCGCLTPTLKSISTSFVFSFPPFSQQRLSPIGQTSTEKRNTKSWTSLQAYKFSTELVADRLEFNRKLELDTERSARKIGVSSSICLLLSTEIVAARLDLNRERKHKRPWVYTVVYSRNIILNRVCRRSARTQLRIELELKVQLIPFE